MKRYNTIASLFLATAMLFAACEKDENGLVSLNVEIDNYSGAGNTKMYVDENNYTHWTSGDDVNINGKNNTCSVDLSGDKAKITDVPTSTAGYLAVYPAGIASYFGTYSSSSIEVTLPSTQTYSVDEGSGKQKINAPMYAYCANGNNTLTFHNLCSLLEVTVNNDRTEDITMQSITVTSSGNNLSGLGVIYGVKTDSPYLTMGTSSTSYKYVTLDFTGASETVSQGLSKSYYIVVPAFSESDITISIVATSTGTLELSKTASDAELNANKIVQGPTLSLGGVAFIGTEENPYKINNLDDLVAFRTKVNFGTTYEGLFVKLMNDIDCGSSWTPIGTSSNNFKGTFDGNSKTITYVIPSTTTGYLGLFGYTQNATIKNLNVDATITQTGSNGNIGGIIARQEGGIVSGCTATGSITSAYYYLGGIVGKNYGNVNNTISNCSSSVNITSSKAGSNFIGGIMGYFYTAGTVTNCSASGDIYAPEATGTYVGGIVGNTTGTTSVTGCGFTGHVRGSAYVGMIAGSKGDKTKTTISTCTYSATNAGETYKGVGVTGSQTGNDNNGGCVAQ